MDVCMKKKNKILIKRSERKAMEIGKKKNKRGRRCRQGVGAAADRDDHQEKKDLLATSKSKKLQYHHQSESSCLARSSRLQNNKNSDDMGCKKEEQIKFGVGVFDFPWLKEEGEGVILKLGDDLCQPGIMGFLEDYSFALHSSAPCSPSASAALRPHRDDPVPVPVHFTTTFSQIADDLCPSSSAAIPLFHRRDDPNKVTEDKPPRRLSSFNLDSNNINDQQMDCIWSSVLDQPLDINLNII